MKSPRDRHACFVQPVTGYTIVAGGYNPEVRDYDDKKKFLGQVLILPLAQLKFHRCINIMSSGKILGYL